MSVDIVEKLYESKEMDYFSLERQIFKNKIQEREVKILDIGCGTGSLGNYFIRAQDAIVYGVEINRKVAEVAQENLTKIIYGNIELIELPDDFVEFDYIIFGDVIEHLVDPFSLLEKVRQRLKGNGKIIITVPNIRYWKTLKKLVFFNRWDYASWGILDYTHLRFFTLPSFVSTLTKHRMIAVESNYVIQEKSISHYINKVTFGLFKSFLATHLIVVISK